MITRASFSIAALQRIYGDDVREKLGGALLLDGETTVEVDTAHPNYRALKPVPQDPAKQHQMQAISEAGSTTRRCCGQ